MGAAPNTASGASQAAPCRRSNRRSSHSPTPSVSAMNSKDGGYFVTLRKAITVVSALSPATQGLSP
ncbi:hypothetical protein D9M69_597010 [compost metagenome]